VCHNSSFCCRISIKRGDLLDRLEVIDKRKSQQSWNPHFPLILCCIENSVVEPGGLSFLTCTEKEGKQDL
jgi:hypothetical protein